MDSSSEDIEVLRAEVSADNRRLAEIADWVPDALERADRLSAATPWPTDDVPEGPAWETVRGHHDQVRRLREILRDFDDEDADDDE